MPSAGALKTLALELLAALAVAALGVFLFLPVLAERAFEQAGETIRTGTGQTLAFDGKPEISFWPLAVTVHNLRWGDESQPLALSVRAARFAPSPFSLLDERPVLRELSLEAPVLTFSASGGDAETGSGQEAGILPGIGLERLPFQTEHLVVRDGEIQAEGADGDRISLSRLSLLARGTAGKDAGEAECDFIGAFRRADGSTVEANVAFSAALRMDGSSVSVSRAQITLTTVQGLYEDDLGPAGLEVAGYVDLERSQFSLQKAVISLPVATVRLNGDGGFTSGLFFYGDMLLETSGKQLAALVPVPGLPETSVKGRVTLSADVLRLSQFDLTAGDSQGTGTLSFGLSNRHLRCRVSVDRLDLEPFVQFLAAGAGECGRARAADADIEETSRVYPQVDLVLGAENVLLRGQSLREASIGVSGRQGLYVLEPIRASFKDGRSLDAVAAVNVPESRWDCSGTLEEYEIAELEDLLDCDMGVGGGSLDVEWLLSGSIGDLSTLARSAGGSGRVTLRRLNAEGLRLAVKNSAAPAGAKLPETVGLVVAPFEVKDGICRWQADLDADGMTGRGRGSLNLEEGLVDAELNLTLNGQVIPLTVSGPIRKLCYMACATEQEESR